MELDMASGALRAPVRERPALELDRTVTEPVIDEIVDRPTALAVCAPAPAPAVCDEDWTRLNAPPAWRQIRRAVRTRAPFLAADLVALVLASLIAQLAMTLVYPPAAKCLG